MIVNLIDSLRNRLGLIKLAGFAIIILLVANDWLLVSKEHAHTSMEQIPGFWSIFGIAASVVLIIASKCLESLGIAKREDYYDK